MKNVIRFLGAILAIITVNSTAAFASNVHLIGDVSVTDGGTSARACGKLAGLGNADVTITLTGSIRIRATEIKNGTVSFCVRTADPACSTAKACGCPNNNWTATIVDVEFESLLLTVEQGGKVVLQETVLD